MKMWPLWVRFPCRSWPDCLERTALCWQSSNTHHPCYPLSTHSHLYSVSPYTLQAPRNQESWLLPPLSTHILHESNSDLMVFASWSAICGMNNNLNHSLIAGIVILQKKTSQVLKLTWMLTYSRIPLTFLLMEPNVFRALPHTPPGFLLISKIEPTFSSHWLTHKPGLWPDQCTAHPPRGGCYWSWQAMSYLGPIKLEGKIVIPWLGEWSSPHLP